MEKNVSINKLIHFCIVIALFRTFALANFQLFISICAYFSFESTLSFLSSPSSSYIASFSLCVLSRSYTEETSNLLSSCPQILPGVGKNLAKTLSSKSLVDVTGLTIDGIHQIII